MKTVVQDLLKNYLNVEEQFQHGQYDKCVALLRDQNKDSMDEVRASIFSHLQVRLIVVRILIVPGYHPRCLDIIRSAWILSLALN